MCATREFTSTIAILSSYSSNRRSDQLFQETKIWEACRATSAATTFFDPISIGKLGIRFVDGAVTANNPVFELWNEAKEIWKSDPNHTVKCLVSIGTGVLRENSFKGGIVGICKGLIKIATETELTAEGFCKDKSELHSKGRYYRFNVANGLDNIGLEDAKRKSEIIAATDEYIEGQEIFKKIEACANKMSGREC